MDAQSGYITNQQGGQAPPVMVINQQAAGGGHHYRSPSGHVGPVIGVLAVITVLGIVAGLVGRLCGGRSVMGYGPRFDVEAWLEAKCSSCLDGNVVPHRHPYPDHPHMHMNTHMVMESVPASVPGGGGGGGGDIGWRPETASMRPHPHPQPQPLQRPHPHQLQQSHLNPELLMRPLPAQPAPVANRSANDGSGNAGRPEAEMRAVREQKQPHQRPVDDGGEDEDEDEDDLSDFSEHSEEDLHHRHHHQEQQKPHQPH
ncbi:hypothetical protein SOVF_030120 [Spinacia oleracea]|uniref:Uncharacterized protein n=1 Tax=Spinacia oleracea TaxID=3562 RepID=A0A9R0JM51_SPIOL|nr:uncharacterized protein LOC110779576 [Spinacia oleracea]KNA22889.1 hypothetical protein SOVF_030120 [Spinacia oleracea]